MGLGVRHVKMKLLGGKEEMEINKDLRKDFFLIFVIKTLFSNEGK